MVSLTGHTDPVNAVAFSPDGRWLASAGSDGCVWLWDVALQTGMVRIAWGAKYVFALAFSPDGQALAVGTETSLLMLREQDGQWKPHQQWKDHHGWVSAVAFDRDGHLLVSGGVDGSVRIWDAQHRRKHALRSFSGRMGPVRSIAFSADGMVVAAGGVSGIGLWRATETEPMIFHRLRDTDIRSLAFTPDSEALIAAAGRSVLRIDSRSSKPEELLSSQPNDFRSLAVAPYYPLLLLGRDDGSILAWDFGASRERHIYRWHTCAVNSVAFHPTGVMAASGGDDFAICYWNLNLKFSDSGPVIG